MVDLPDIGFLFPAFNNRSEDGEGVLYYSKDANAFEQMFLAQVLNCEVPLSAGSQKENFQVLVEETLGEECNYETIKNIHENLNEMIQEGKSIEMSCHFCNKNYEFTVEELKEILRKCK